MDEGDDTMTTTAIAPTGARQINQNLYVGYSDLTTIQKGVDFARKDGGIFVVVIPRGYAGSDTIASVVNGTANVILSDQRSSTAQNYIWSLSAYVPANFTQLGPITAPNFLIGTNDISFPLHIMTGQGIPTQACLETADPSQYATLTYLTPGQAWGVGVAGLNAEPFVAGHWLITDVTNGNKTLLHIAPDTGDTFISGNLTAPSADLDNLAISELFTADAASIDTLTVTSLAGNSAVFTGALRAGGTTLYSAADGTPNGDATIRNVLNGAVSICAPSGTIYFNYESGTGGFGFCDGEQHVTAQIGHAGDAHFAFCYVDGSPVVTEATLPPNSMVYPPNGIGVSTGSAWGDSIDPATIPRLNTANTFTANMTVNGLLHGQEVRGYGQAALDISNSNVSIGLSRDANLYAQLSLIYANGAANQKIWSLTSMGTQLSFSADNDSGGKTSWMTVTRTGGTASQVTFAPDVVIQGQFITNVGTFNTSMTAGGITLYNAAAATQPGPNIRNDGANILINPASGGTYIGWESGNGWTYFGNGGGVEVGQIEPGGNALFTGNYLTGGGFQLFCEPPGKPNGNATFRNDGSNILLNAPATGNIYFNFDRGGGQVYFMNGGTTLVSITPDGTIATINLEVYGSKSFRIPHPTEPGMDLLHYCLEGPENGVYYYGEARCENGVVIVTLPDYFEPLTLPTGRSVILTQIDNGGELALLAASPISGGKFTIRASIKDALVAWEVLAVRAGVTGGTMREQRKTIPPVPYTPEEPAAAPPLPASTARKDKEKKRA
jgi:hypothetical protein